MMLSAPSLTSLLLLLLQLQCSSATLTVPPVWDAQRDDLSEYQLERTVANVGRESACVMMAEEQSGQQQQQLQAVAFSQAGGGGTCSMYSCRLGWSGCRKCRNARNSSLPMLFVRRVNELGHTCWRTFQHRVDGSVDFYRNWTDFLTAFGPGEDSNYWLGLEAIHQLTQAGNRRVRWEMSMWNGSRFWWENAFFAVQGAGQGYRASVGDQDTGRSNVIQCTVPGAFLNNRQFSTPDNDQDAFAGGSCALKYQGSWWYGNCHCFNPNGQYFTPPDALDRTGSLLATGLTFAMPGMEYPFNNEYSMMTFECMVSDVV